MNGTKNRSLFQPRNDAFRHSRGRRHAQRFADQASLATEIARTKNCDDGFLALHGYDRELYLAFLDVKNTIRGIALRKDSVLFANFGYGHTAVSTDTCARI